MSIYFDSVLNMVGLDSGFVSSEQGEQQMSHDDSDDDDEGR